MKKILYIYLSICSLFSFYIALQAFDNYVNSTYYSFYEYSTTSLQIGDDIEINMEEFTNVLKKHDISAYRLHISFETKTTEVYIFNDNYNFLENILFESNHIEKTTKNIVYDSKSDKKNTRLYNPIENDRYFIRSIISLENISGEYLIAGTHITDFYNELTQTYDKSDVMLTENIFHNNIDFINKNMISLLCLVLVTFIYILLFNIYIVKNSKHIQLLKLEGYSNFKIYYQFLLKNILLGTILKFFLYIPLMFLCLKTPFVNWKIFILYLAIIEVIFLISLLVSSILIYVTITSTSINISIKGKEQYRYQQNTNYIIKLLLLIFSVTFIFQGIEETRKYIVLSSQDTFYKDNLENVFYTFTQSSISKESDAEKTKAMYQYLLEHNHLFTYMPLVSIATEQQVIEIGKNFLYLYDIVDADFVFDEDTYYYFFPPTIDHTISLTYTLDAYSFAENSESYIYENKKIPLLSTVPITNNIQGNECIYMYNPNIDDLESFLYFTYDGDRNDAQAYLNQLYKEHGLKENYMTLQNAYEGAYTAALLFQKMNVTAILPLSLLLSISIILNEVQMVYVNFEIHKKRSILMLIEGRSKWNTYIDYLITQFSLLILFYLIHIVVLKTPIYQVTIVTMLSLLITQTSLSLVSRKIKLEVQ